MKPERIWRKTEGAVIHERPCKTLARSFFHAPRSALHVREAMTLLELMVVIAILAILLGVAIPVISPADDSRRLREAARGVNTFISGAKVRARETGRPFGVALKKLSRDTGRADDNGLCVEMYYVEEQPPYAGFDSNARVMIGTDAIQGGAANLKQLMLSFVRYADDVPQNQDGLPPSLDSDDIPSGVIRPGDVVLIMNLPLVITDTGGDNGQELVNGYFETGYGRPRNSLFVTAQDGDINSFNFAYDGSGNRVVDPNAQVEPSDGNFGRAARFWTEPLRYKILRQPTKTSSEPFQLPNNAAIDLEASGFALNVNPSANRVDGVRFHNPYELVNNTDDVIVMFSPEGTISEAYYNTGQVGNNLLRSLISRNLFLLIGLRENQPAPESDFHDFSGPDAEKQDEKEKINWLNGDSRWVVVGAQTGSVATAENAFVDPEQYATATLPPSGQPRLDELSRRRGFEIINARELAIEAVGMGGR